MSLERITCKKYHILTFFLVRVPCITALPYCKPRDCALEVAVMQLLFLRVPKDLCTT